MAPSGIFVPANAEIASPADLAGVPISVGFQSGSHYATIQALETYLEKQQINLSFDDCLAAPIISPSNSAIARSSTLPS